MKNRLEVARELLSENGSIAISIDHHENHSLKFILEEVFGADNFIQDVIVETSSPAGFKLVNPGPVKVTEYIIFYAKDKKTYLPTEKKLFVEDKTSEVYKEIITNPNEKYTKWKTTSFDKYVLNKLEVKDLKELKKKYNEDLAKEIFNTTKRELAVEYADYLFTTYKPDNPSKALLEKVIESKKTPNIFIEYNSINNSKYYLKNGRIVAFYKNKLKEVKNKLVPTKHLTNLWTDISWSGITNEGGVLLNKAKKPEAMLKRIIELSTNEGDLVMDFFAGSGTTGAVAHKMNRNYVLIEQMEYIHELPEKRLINVISGDETGISKDVDWKGGGSFVYTELLEWNNKYIRDLESAKTKADIKKIKAKIEKEAFYKYQIDTNKFDNKEFDKLSEKEQKEVLIDVLDMNHLYVNLNSINDTTFSVSKEDKELNKKFYNQK
jgi:adenine-specific DNA-methyltransferase